MKERASLRLFERLGGLKDIKRSGWIMKDIPNPESVADHVFRTVLMAMILGDIMNLDCEKLMKMAAIHDLAEIITGDITPHNGVTMEEKHKRERQGLENLFNELPVSEGYINLWLEYERGESVEARIIKDIDCLEMAMTAGEYQIRYPEKDLSEFTSKTERAISSPEVKSLFDMLKNWEKANSGQAL